MDGGTRVVRAGERALVVICGEATALLEPGEQLTIGSSSRCRLQVPGLLPREAWVEQNAPREVIVARSHGDGADRLERMQVDGAAALGQRALLLGRRAACDAVLRGPTSVVWQGFVARSPLMLEALGELARVGVGAAPVWIQGESGTGKELAAKAVHQISGRARGPFVALNCAALPEALAESELFGVVRGAFTGADRTRPGAFQRAHGGTLFLDEIGELSLALQAKLLRVLETREVLPIGADRPVPVDVRVVAATWRDPHLEVIAGRFRHDLMHRLCVLQVRLPALRERPDDVMPLVAEALLARDALHLMPDPVLARQLESYAWSGNVRELRNGIERAVTYQSAAALLPTRGDEARLPRRRGRSSPMGLGVAVPIAQGLVSRTLRHEQGNRVRAARALGVSRSTLYRWMRDLGHVGSGRVDTPPAPFMMAQARKT